MPPTFASTHDRGIILAADVTSLSELSALLRAASHVPEVVGVKVGFSLALHHGLGPVVRAVRNVSDLPVIYDHQKAGTDIPQMGERFAAICRSASVCGVILFPQAGPETLKGFVSAALDHEVIPIVGLVMTHRAYLRSEGGYIVDDAPDLICQAALDLGVTTFVLPGTKPDIIRRFASAPLASCPSAAIMMPGIGSQGGAISAAFAAAAPHRRFAIIGSAVYRASDPQAALVAFAEEIKA